MTTSPTAPAGPQAPSAAAAVRATLPVRAGLGGDVPAAGGGVQSLPLSRLLGHAADAVQAVRAGRSLDDALARTPAEARAGTQALAFHALRRLGGVTLVRTRLAPKAPAAEVDALLLVALSLLWPPPPGAALPYPEHTLVDQAVAAMRQRAAGAAGFTNAVLRRFVRERDALVAAARLDPLGAYDHPPWWIERVRRDWPALWQPLLHAAGEHPPMTLRVNARRLSGADYLQRLAAQGRSARLLDDPAYGGQALVLAEPCPVQALPGWADGEVSVQDAAAQRAAPLLLGGGQGAGTGAGVPALPPGARVLDACAAPGGKTAHLLERAGLDLLALDSDAQRLVRVQETLARLQLPARGAAADGGRVELRAADAGDPRAWWDGRPFDAILLDAPCTASGIVRRHPDIRWLRRAEDLLTLARTQARLLDALWPLLKPGGRLLYATCSIFRAEGSLQIDAFLQRLPPGTARLDPASPGHLLPLAENPAEVGPVPGPALQDGFFYALLHKH